MMSRWAKIRYRSGPKHYIKTKMHCQRGSPHRAGYLHTEALHEVDHLRASAQCEDMPGSPAGPLPRSGIEIRAQPASAKVWQDVKHRNVRPAEEEILTHARRSKLSVHLCNQHVLEGHDLAHGVAQNVGSSLELIMQDSRFRFLQWSMDEHSIGALLFG